MKLSGLLSRFSEQIQDPTSSPDGDGLAIPTSTIALQKETTPPIYTATATTTPADQNLTSSTPTPVPQKVPSPSTSIATTTPQIWKLP